MYLGDSATLSYLQFIRMIVESVDGPSQFTMDPSRHRLMELTTSLPPDTRTSLLLPDRRTADVLIRSYLTNVSLTSVTLPFLTQYTTSCWTSTCITIQHPNC